MRKYFFTGLIALLPITVTLIIILWLFNLFTQPFVGITEWIIRSYEYNLSDSHTFLVQVCSRVLALIVLLVLILTLGFFGRKFLIQFFLKVLDKIFSYIPIVRTIYRLSLDITKAVFTPNQKTLKDTILTPFPSSASHAIAFTTGEVPEALKKKINADLVIFVPTAPHPMSGFVLLVPKDQTTPIDMSVEEAFKFLISCGAMKVSSPK